jgi:hypothetical protein
MARKPNPLASKKSVVSLSRNGLTLQVEDIPAADCALVAQALLDAMRQMVAAGYDELVPDAGSVHAGPLGEVPEEGDGSSVKRIGFTG